MIRRGRSRPFHLVRTEFNQFAAEQASVVQCYMSLNEGSVSNAGTSGLGDHWSMISNAFARSIRSGPSWKAAAGRLFPTNVTTPTSLSGALWCVGYTRLNRLSKGAVRRYLAKMTGLSRAQVTRLIGQHRATGRVVDRRRGHSGRPFERIYGRRISACWPRSTRSNQMCGPATCAVLRRGPGRYSATDGSRLGVPVQCAPVQPTPFQPTVPSAPCPDTEFDGDADRRARAAAAARAAQFCAAWTRSTKATATE